MVEEYRELGFEVRVEDVDPDGEECTSPILPEPESVKTIYVSKKGNGKS